MYAWLHGMHCIASWHAFHHGMHCIASWHASVVCSRTFFNTSLQILVFSPDAQRELCRDWPAEMRKPAVCHVIGSAWIWPDTHMLV